MTSVLNAHAFFVVVDFHDFQVRPRVSISGRWQSFRSSRRPGGRRPILVLLGRGVLLAMVEDKRCDGGGGGDGGGHRVFKPWFVWRFFVKMLVVLAFAMNCCQDCFLRVKTTAFEGTIHHVVCTSKLVKSLKSADRLFRQSQRDEPQI